MCFLLPGSFSIKNVTPSPEGEASKIKIKLRMNIHGVFSVSTASMVEKVITPPEAEPEAMETDHGEKKADQTADKNPANGEEVF